MYIHTHIIVSISACVCLHGKNPRVHSSSCNVIKHFLRVLSFFIFIVFFKIRYEHSLIFFFLINLSLAVPHSMQDIISLTRDQTLPPAVEVPSLKHWAAREVPPQSAS